VLTQTCQPDACGRQRLSQIIVQIPCDLPPLAVLDHVQVGRERPQLFGAQRNPPLEFLGHHTCLLERPFAPRQIHAFEDALEQHHAQRLGRFEIHFGPGGRLHPGHFQPFGE